MSSSSFAQQIAIGSALPRLSVGMTQKINIGFLAPLSGPAESWGQPGLNGCRLWAEWLNRAGGLLLGGRRFPVHIHAYDCGYDTACALKGARHLVQEHDVSLMMMLGGDSFSAVRDFLMGHKVLTSTLLTSDLSPDTPYLIAPSESLPIYTVTAVDWIARNRPEIRTVALCSQTDALGLPALAAYRAAFKVAGIEIVSEIRYDPEAARPDTVVGQMLDARPDMLCWCASYTPMVHEMTEYARTPCNTHFCNESGAPPASGRRNASSGKSSGKDTGRAAPPARNAGSPGGCMSIWSMRCAKDWVERRI